MMKACSTSWHDTQLGVTLKFKVTPNCWFYRTQFFPDRHTGDIGKGLSMCRASDEGGRRCTDDNAFGLEIRRLQAKKQYHALKGNTAVVDEMTQEMQQLRDNKAELTVDGGALKPYSMPLTPSAERVLAQLREDGFAPYVVGGSVRDALLGLESKDVDIEVYKATPDQVIASLRKIGNVDEVGKSFGVLKISIGSEDFDVSLPRKESKTGDSHRGFSIEMDPDLTMTEATARRDYTVNALMYDSKLGYIIDKHDGLKDLENRKLRHVSDAFDEDPLRVLRGVQMASRFNMELDESTLEKARSLSPQFDTLAKERVQVEFQKMYEKGTQPVKAFRLLKDTNWDTHFAGLSDVNNTELAADLERNEELIRTGQLSKKQRVLVLSATIGARLPDREARSFLGYTIVGDDMKNAAYSLSRVQKPEESDAGYRHWVRDLPRNVTVSDWVLLKRSQGDTVTADKVEAKTRQLGINEASEPDLLTGDDLLSLFPGSRPGRWIGQSITKARAAQYDSTFRTKEASLEWARKNVEPE
jgi:tRNA nucleotidyltransferase/poly(A) polymerase